MAAHRTHHPFSSDLLATLASFLQGVAFWVAIGLSAGYPIAFLYPEASAPEFLLGLIGLHATALLLGHGYERE